MITPPVDTECIRLNDVIGRERVGDCDCYCECYCYCDCDCYDQAYAAELLSEKQELVEQVGF